ncbi:MAG: type II secretion system major pseudopilin GspG [Planctomycetota bacterium]
MNTRSPYYKSARNAARAGFTLVELLVVIVIIGLLAGAVAMNFDKIIPQAKKTRVADDLRTLQQAIEMYKYQNGSRLPDGLERLIDKDDNGIAYLKNLTSVPRDPWDNEYVYQPSSNGMTFQLLSYGQDGAPGGEGEAADISLEILNEKKKN